MPGSGGGKRQELTVTRASRIAAVAYAVIDVVEEVYEEEVDLLGIGVSSKALEEPRGPIWDVRVSYPGRRGLLGERRLDAMGVVVRVSSDPEEMLDYNMADIYRAVALAPLRLDGHRIKKAALETTMTGVEFMFIYTDTGHLAVLEGEEYRVRIPFVKAVAAYHTHPEGSCGLSGKDIESGVDLLSEGGIAEAAATPSCAAVLYRLGFITEDDYIELKRAARKPYGKPPRLEAARLELVSY